MTVPAAYAGEETGSDAMVLEAGASEPDAAVMALVGAALEDADATEDAAAEVAAGDEATALEAA